jgi:ferric-dicitrate binding protein FerR (iron transport regulator)
MYQEIEQIIIKSLSGEISGEEIIILSEWLSCDPGNKENYKKIRAYWDAEVSGIQISDSTQSFNKLINRIKKEEKHIFSSSVWKKGLKIAVAAAFAGICLYWTFIKNEATHTQHFSYITGNSISEISLPDGTQVSLNKNSTLSFTDSNKQRKREVNLTGEAYFNVAKNKELPFVVNLGETKITVLGTIFNVKNRTEDAVIQTTLLEGSIRFETPEQTVLLKPDQLLLYNKSDQKININNADPGIIAAWKDNLIRYKSIPFTTFLEMLEDHYQVKIRLVDGSLKEQLVSGTFDANLSVEQILDILKKSMQYQWKKDGDIYEIRK